MIKRSKLYTTEKYETKNHFYFKFCLNLFSMCLGVGAMAEVASIVSLIKDHLEKMT